MDESIVPAAATPAAPPVNFGLLQQLKSIAEKPTASFGDLRKALDRGLKRLLTLERDIDNEVYSCMIRKDASEVHKLWKERVSNIEKEVTSLNNQYDVEGTKIKRALNEVIELVEECEEKILVDKMPEEVIKEIDVPLIWDYPTILKAFRDILRTVLQDNGAKCVALEGGKRVWRTIIMHKLNNYFYDRFDREFDMVIFIKVPASRLHVLQKIAERMKVDREGNEDEVAARIQKALENKRYLLILDGLWDWVSKIDKFMEKLDISNNKRDSRVVITDSSSHVGWSYIARRVELPCSLISLSHMDETEARTRLFECISSAIHLPHNIPTVDQASGSKGTTSSEPRSPSGKFHPVPWSLRTRDLLHLILSYPMTVGYEHFLHQWINDLYQLAFANNDADFDSFRRRIEHLLCDGSPLRYVHVVIPEHITEVIINGGSISKETPLKHAPPDILPLATHLALHQLTQILTPDRAAPWNIQNIWFSTRHDAEKRTVVEYIQANSLIRAAFDDLQIIDLNRFDDNTERELQVLNLETRLKQTDYRWFLLADDTRSRRLMNDRSRRLMIVVDGDGDKRLDPQKARLPIHQRDSEKVVVVFITTLSSSQQNDYLTNRVDLTIKTEHHLLPWELFCNVVGIDLLHSSVTIHEIAVQIVQKCEGHLLAILLMAKSLKDVKDVQIWELALKNLRYRDCQAIVNAFFHSIRAKVISETEMVRLIRCLMVFKSQDLMISDSDLFSRWISEQLVDSKEEAEIILQYFMGCSVLLQFEDTRGQQILLPDDIKIILYVFGEDILENLSEGASVSTISDLQGLNLSPTHMQILYDDIAHRKCKLNLEGCMLETLPRAIFKISELEILSLERCSQLLELPSEIGELQNLKELSLAGCERLETLPQEIFILHKLETLSLEHCSRLLELPRQIGKLENLRKLMLEGCEQLKALPQEIWELRKLHALSLPSSTLKREVHKGFNDTHTSNLPRSLNFPNLKTLSLGKNPNVMKIPPLFFNNLPLLSILDLSRTSIHELPGSIFKLQGLKELYLKDCELFGELPREINQLTNLTTLDLDGTLITHLPEEIQELSNLESLSLSFYNDSSSAVIPIGVLSKLTHLKVLRVGINSDNEWWLKYSGDILADIKGLNKLEALDMYFPRVKSLHSMFSVLPNFKFIIGHHKPRMISRVPLAIEVRFKESSPSLKFVNGNGQNFPPGVTSALSEACAFFLDRHMTINNLTQFGAENLKRLRLCIVAECNEMQSIVDAAQCGSYLDKYGFPRMQFLTIFYMKNLRCIIDNPVSSNSIFSELKLLALHTCPQLTTIFTMDSLHKLGNLEELIVEDCPKVSSIITCPSDYKQTEEFFLPRLRKLSLIFVPGLESISNGVRIGRNLEQMGFYYCPKLQSLSTAELSSEKLKAIKGEKEWWEALEWGQQDEPHKFNAIFSEIDENLDIFTQLTSYELITSFNRK